MVVRITLTHRTQYLSLLLQNLVLLSQQLLWHRHCGETVAPRVGDTCLESQNKRLSVSKFILRIMNDLRVQKGSCSLGTQIFLFMCPFFFFFFKIFFSYRPFFKSYWICYNIVSVLCFSFQAVRHLQSPARDRTHISCIGRWSLNHWTTREVPTHVPSKDSLSIALCSPYSLYIPSPNSMKLQLHTQGPSPKSLPPVPLLFLEIYPPLSCTVGFFFFTTSPSSCGL